MISENIHSTLANPHLDRLLAVFDRLADLGLETDQQSVLTLMSKQLAQVVDAGACVICRLDMKTKTVIPLVEYVANNPNLPAQTWRRLNRPIPLERDPIGRQMMAQSEPFIRRAHSSVTPANGREQPLTWQTVLALPYGAQDQFTGFIELYYTDAQHAISADEIKVCRILANHTAIALQQAHFFEQTVQRLSEMSMLYTLAHEISTSLDFEDVLTAAVTSLRQVASCRACCIFLLDESQTQLEIKAASGLKPHWRKMAKLKLGEGAAGIAAAEGRMVYMPDTHKDDKFVVFDADVRSLMVVPLKANGRIIGTINFDDRQPHAFGPAQERLLTIAAVQVGITIENARLFTKMSEERQQIRAIIQHMADGVLLLDELGDIVTCNPALAVMLGLSPGQIMGYNSRDPHLHPNLASVVGTPTRQLRTDLLTAEVHLESPQPRTLQIFVTPVTGQNKQRFGEVRVIHDVTKERELERLKDDFFSTVSHELRTPLFSIQGFAKIMLEDRQLPPDRSQEFLGAIKRQAQQLSEMVNNLLDLSKFDAGKIQLDFQPLNLLEIIDQTVFKLQGFAHQQAVIVNTELPPQLPWVLGDGIRLEQVLTNLIGNAIKFSDAGQPVTVTAGPMGREVLVQVKDQGIGIAKEELDQIFSRYYQAGNKSERSAMGTGLGLHIAKKIVEGHQGRIWAESSPGQGSTFCFTLPVAN
ncbi:MAG TPA: ATP-binding protein [Anaerolineae bacterium]|nr:ATP-binding protein [Anaerolineae bacterium]